MTDIVEELLNDTKTEWSLENGEPKRNKIIRPLSEKAAAEITRQRETIAELVAALIQAKTDMLQVYRNHGYAKLEASDGTKRIDAALTKAKETRK